MPTEDYSNTSRTSKLRQRSSLKGLNKVARALDYDTQLSIQLGGVVEKTKNSSGISYDCACPPNGVNAGCVGTFKDQASKVGSSYECDGNQCVGPVGAFFQDSFPQIDAIPGTSVTTSGSVAIVNCTSSPVNVSKRNLGDQFDTLLGVLQPGNYLIDIVQLVSTSAPVTYIFS